MKRLILIISTAMALVSCEKEFDGYNPSDVPYFEPLAPPAPGEGYQIHVEAFPIQPNFEREIYVRKNLGNTEEVYLTGFEMKARPGTHHLIAYKFLDDDLPPMNVMYDQNMPNNTLSLRSFRNSVPLLQSPAASYQFSVPNGYGLKVPANASFFMNSHYFNKTNEIRFGEIFMNFFTAPASSVNQLLDVEYYGNDTFVLEPNEEKTVVSDFIMEKKTVIPMMVSHYHKRGRQFDVQIIGGSRNGEIIYSSTYYENPVVETFDTPLVFEAGEGIRTIVKYNNDTDRQISFGITSEDEMNIIICFQYNL
jgi:hypothetical protein